jgi:hypothetical protein
MLRRARRMRAFARPTVRSASGGLAAYPAEPALANRGRAFDDPQAGENGGTLTQQNSTASPAEGSLRRFHVELFIKHPALDPADISTALGLEAHFAQRVGDPRRTPKGTPLSGNYPDTRWRHRVECGAMDQWFAAEATSLLDRLEPHKAFFAELKSSGGSACLIIQFFNDGYLSDELPHACLAKLVELGLDLGIECFAD